MVPTVYLWSHLATPLVATGAPSRGSLFVCPMKLIQWLKPASEVSETFREAAYVILGFLAMAAIVTGILFVIGAIL